MLIGYIRATKEEGVKVLHEQLKTIIEYGVKWDDIFIEMIDDRFSPGNLESCLEYFQKGDKLVVTNLSKLGGSQEEVMKNTDLLSDMSIKLVVVPMNKKSKARTIKTVRKITPKMLNLAVEMLKSGSKITQVAKTFKIHQSTLYHYVGRYGDLREKGIKLLKGSRDD